MARKSKMTQEQIKSALVKNMKKEGLWNSALDFQVDSLTASIMAVNLAKEEIAGLKSTFVIEKSRYGEKMEPHPAFTVLSKFQAAVTAQMKILGLTTADLAMDEQADPMVELTKKINNSTDDIITVSDD